MIHKRHISKPRSYDPDSHSVEWVLNDGKKDVDGEILVASGARLPKTMKAFDSHNSTSFTKIAGTWKNLRVDGKAIIGTLFFSQANPLGQLAEGMVAEGHLDAVSVGFEPFAWTNGDGKKETRTAGDLMPYYQAGRKYTDYEVGEASLVGLPSNRGALVRMCKAYGIKADAEQLELDASPKTEKVPTPYGMPVIISAEWIEQAERIEFKLDQLLGMRKADPSRVNPFEGAAFPDPDAGITDPASIFKVGPPPSPVNGR
jgi:hypothetical protein